MEMEGHLSWTRGALINDSAAYGWGFELLVEGQQGEIYRIAHLGPEIVLCDFERKTELQRHKGGL